MWICVHCWQLKICSTDLLDIYNKITHRQRFWLQFLSSTCLKELSQNISNSQDVLASCKSRELFDGLSSNLSQNIKHGKNYDAEIHSVKGRKLTTQKLSSRVGTHLITYIAYNTHRHIFILAKIKLSIYGCISQLRKAAEKLGNKLCCQTFLLGATLHTIHDYLVGIFVLQKKRKSQKIST